MFSSSGRVLNSKITNLHNLNFYIQLFVCDLFYFIAYPIHLLQRTLKESYDDIMDFQAHSNLCTYLHTITCGAMTEKGILDSNVCRNIFVFISRTSQP